MLLKTSCPKGDVSYTVGKHAMKFGLSYNRYTKNQKLFLSAQGSNTFSGATGDPFMDMVLGLDTGGYNKSQAAPRSATTSTKPHQRTRWTPGR